jgi:thiosulfate reductase cytochrome b subunit
MSKPHSSKDLNFVKHATKPSTYVPGHRKVHYVFAWLLVCIGIATLCTMLLIMTHAI